MEQLTGDLNLLAGFFVDSVGVCLAERSCCPL